MREILLLSHRLPYPPNKGEKIRAWHFLRHLSSRYTVHLGALTCPKERPEDLQVLRERCGETRFVPVPNSPLRATNIGALFTGEPISLRHFRSAELRNWVQDLTARRPLDAILAYSSTMAQFVPATGVSAFRRVIDFVDVDSEKWRNYAGVTSGPRKWLYAREARGLAAYERRTALSFDASVLVSDHEATLLRALAPEASEKVITIENGVDLESFRPGLGTRRPEALGDCDGVFIGAMDYRPNVDGVLWFCKQVLPQVLAHVPHFRFVVIGPNPDPEVLRLKRHPNIHVLGAIEVIQPYLEHARLAVIPLRFSPGIPNKVLEAMAMQKAIMTTPAAIQGLRNVRPGHDLFAKQDATAFARTLVRLLETPGMASEIAWKARRTVEASYSWERNLERLERLLAVGPLGLTEAA